METRTEHNKTVPEDVGTTTMLWKEEETLSHRAARFLGIRNKFSAYNTRTAGKLSQTYAMTRLYFRSQSKRNEILCFPNLLTVVCTSLKTVWVDTWFVGTCNGIGALERSLAVLKGSGGVVMTWQFHFEEQTP